MVRSLLALFVLSSVCLVSGPVLADDTFLDDTFLDEPLHPGAWWAQAAAFRRGGVDRILVPEPWSLTIDELIESGTSGEVYAHELVTTAPGAAGRYLEALAEVGCETMAAFEGSSVGAFRVGETFLAQRACFPVENRLRRGQPARVFAAVRLRRISWCHWANE